MVAKPYGVKNDDHIKQNKLNQKESNERLNLSEKRNL